MEAILFSNIKYLFWVKTTEPTLKMLSSREDKNISSEDMTEEKSY